MIQRPTSTVDYPLQHPGILGSAPKQSSGILPTAILFAASLIYFLVSVHIGWYHTISDAYAFRQSQTAISVDSMLRGGPWLIYETPVLGPPWTIPFEFPVFQWIVAILIWSTGMAIEPAGRTVSIIFFLLTLWPTDRILSKLHISLACRLIMLSLLLCSPFYIFWSRTFLIESTALFFAVSSLAYTLHVIHHPSIARLLLLASIAGLAALVKITTFLPLLFASVVIIFNQLRCPDKAGNRSTWLSQVAIVLSGIVFPALALFAWTITVDHAKSHSILGQRLISTQLNSWTFGTLQQRLSAETWIQFADRVQLPIGRQFSVTLPFLALIVARHRWTETFGCLLLYLAGPLTFTNLFYIHEYYYFANNIFLILAIGMVIVAMIERGQYFETIAIAGVVFLLASMVTTYFQLYRPIQSHNVLTYQRSELSSRVPQ